MGSRAAQRSIAEMSIKTPSISTPIGSLSGGNQQKAVLARTLSSRPLVVLAEEPTQGVDAGARVEIYRILRAAADDGACVVVLSSDGVELEGLCDRVLIMSRGHIVEELEGPEVTETAITGAALKSTTERNRQTESPSRWTKIRRWGDSDHSPALVIAAAVILLGIAVGLRNPAYLSALNMEGFMLMLAPVIFVGLAQAVVVMAGGFDLSVGPLTGFLVVAGSYWIVDGQGILPIGIGIFLMLAAATVVGLVNAILVNNLGINPVVATLAMFMALRGLSLTLRPTPAGIINSDVVSIVEFSFGPIPIALLLAVIVAFILQIALRRSRWGAELRAVGSNPQAAARLGIRVGRVRVLSYLTCALLVVPAAFLLMAQVGIGDPKVGVNYTLVSITAVVLGGASIFGGRGSFIGVVLGAALIQQLVNVTTFLRLSEAWQYGLLALLTLTSATTYATLRKSSRIKSGVAQS